MRKRLIIDVEADIYVDFDEFDLQTPAQIIDRMRQFIINYPNRDLYFYVESYGYDGGKELRLRERRLETDKEFDRRIKEDNKNKEKEKLTKATKQAKEIAEYARLKKKYERMENA